jgi:hypothetical protein
MISFVNGFLCTCSCDVSKAKRGVDPHPKSDGDPSAEKPKTKNGVVNADDPAVKFGGALAGVSAAANVSSPDAVQPAAAANTQSQALAIDILV